MWKWVVSGLSSRIEIFPQLAMRQRQIVQIRVTWRIFLHFLLVESFSQQDYFPSIRVYYRNNYVSLFSLLVNSAERIGNCPFRKKKKKKKENTTRKPIKITKQQTDEPTTNRHAKGWNRFFKRILPVELSKNREINSRRCGSARHARNTFQRGRRSKE